jgi:uncharacterized delta-60 repeat protein
VLTDFSGAGRLDFPSAVVVQPYGQIVAIGDSNAAGSFDVALARYNNDGTLDTGFGTGGTVLSDLTGTGGGDFGYAAAIQSRGRIVVAGASDAHGTYDFAVAR